MGGCLGMMAKFGPFCRSVNCSLERGVLERLITHLSNGALHVCGLGGLLLIGLSSVGGLAVVVVEGVEGTGVAGTLEVMEGVEVLGELLDGTFGWPLKPVIVIGVVKNIVVPGEIMMVSMDFVVKPLKLINLFCFDFVVTMVFYSVDEKSGSFYYVFLVL